MTMMRIEPLAERWTWAHRPAMYTICAPILTLTGAITNIIAPLLLAPALFGQFVLLASVFQYAGDFDLGLSRLTDRLIPQTDSGHDLLWTRIGIGVCLWVGMALTSTLITDGWQLMIAVTGGLAFMLSNGMVSIYRSSHRIGEFTIAAVLMQLGMSLPRLLGLLLAGVKGCFAVLLVWYTMSAVVLLGPLASHRPSIRRMVSLTGEALPLFAFSTFWSLYLLANRWIAALLTTPHETGLFGFGAMLVTTSVNVMITITQVHYPKHLLTPDQPRLAREIRWLLLLTGSGVVVGIAGCRYIMPIIFPAFAAGTATTAAILLTAIPLNICGWLMPLVVAKANNAWRDASKMLGTGILLLTSGMMIGGSGSGLAWGCLPSAVVLFVMYLRHLVHSGLLDARTTNFLMLGSGLIIMLGGIEWHMLFRLG